MAGKEDTLEVMKMLVAREQYINTCSKVWQCSSKACYAIRSYQNHWQLHRSPSSENGWWQWMFSIKKITVNWSEIHFSEKPNRRCFHDCTRKNTQQAWSMKVTDLQNKGSRSHIPFTAKYNLQNNVSHTLSASVWQLSGDDRLRVRTDVQRHAVWQHGTMLWLHIPSNCT